MTRPTMSLARFASIVDAYGAVPDRWPPVERDAALALLEASLEARALLERAATLDRLLDALPAPGPSAALRAAILRRAPGRARLTARSVVASRAAAAALAASLVLGMVAGAALALATATDVGVDVLQLALFDDHPAGY